MSSLPLANHNFSTPTNHIPGLSRTTFVFKDIQGPKFAVFKFKYCQGWLGRWVVSTLDSSADGPRVQIAVATLSGNSLRQTVHTHCTSVHQTAKLVAAILRVARVTAGLAESNGSLPQGLCRTSPAGWLPRTGISSGTIRSVIEYGLPLPFFTVKDPGVPCYFCSIPCGCQLKCW